MQIIRRLLRGFIYAIGSPFMAVACIIVGVISIYYWAFHGIFNWWNIVGWHSNDGGKTWRADFSPGTYAIPRQDRGGK